MGRKSDQDQAGDGRGGVSAVCSHFADALRAHDECQEAPSSQLCKNLANCKTLSMALNAAPSLS